MRKSFDILRRGSLLIGRVGVGLSAVALCFASCGTTSTVPIDDAYIWQEKTSAKTTQSTQPKQPSTPSTPTQAEPASTPAPTIEVLSVQDTTITVRIKK